MVTAGMNTCRLMVLGRLLAMALGGSVMAQSAPGAPITSELASFIEIIPARDIEPVWLATAQVVRIGRVEDYTVIDTAAWVQQRTIEPIEALARRLISAGQRLIALTDLSGRRVYLSVDRIVLIREAQGRYATGARTSIVMVGLRSSSDVAVREAVPEVIAALRREASDRAPRESGSGAAP